MDIIQKFNDRQRLIISIYLSNKRLLLPIFLIALLFTESTSTLTINILSDAFWQVSAFVAVTLALYHSIASKLSQYKKVTQVVADNKNYQILFASFMGVIPGCGGAIIIITQYVQGRFSFGAVVAVLTATMGDAAFLLIAAQPKTAALVLSSSFVVGIISGSIVNLLHNDDFMRTKHKTPLKNNNDGMSQNDKINTKLQGIFWQWMLLPASIIAIMTSLQINIDDAFHLSQGTIKWIGASAAMIALTLWAFSGEVTNYQSAVSEDSKVNSRHFYQKIAQDTNFITTWVVLAFLAFELTILLTGIDLANLFSHWLSLAPLIGVVIGLLPGCGPQILTTSLYLSGVIPLSAQLGNSISNDGDALFPAIAMAPKMAIVATLYSSIPAIIVAYGYYFIFE